MGKISNIAGLFGDVKTRTIVIFTVIILAVGIGVGLTGLTGSDIPASQSQAAGVPRGIQSVPGAGTATEEYERLQLQRNREALAAARESGTSAIPTLTGGFNPNPREQAQQTETTQETTSVQERIRLQQERTQSRIALQKAQVEAQQRLQQQQQFEQETREGMFKSMGKQAKTLLNGWTAEQTQSYVIGTASKDKEGENGDGNRNNRGSRSRFGRSTGVGAAGRSATENLARAGDMTFAVLSTSIDSDDKGPILATIVSGKLKGSRILGEYETNQNGQRVLLRFNSMTMPKAQKSININAVAVNPFNGRTGLATSVDNHLLRRYGSLFVSSLLKGYGEAIKDEGSSITTTGSGTTIESTPDRSSSEQLLIALSEVGTTLGGKVDKIFDTKPTVKVKEGVGLGILFLADVAGQDVG